MNEPKILIVDDDPALLQALPETLFLRMEGVRVDACDSAIAALDLIASTDYDAIIADIKMPGMDGLVLLSQISKLRPDTPTLLITGHGDQDLAIQALRGGAYDLIQKPIERDYFLASLMRAIQSRQLQREVEAKQLALERHAHALEQIIEERTRELREANRLKDEFLAVVSHELRTPLSSILSWAQMLRTENLDQATCAVAYEVIERNAKSQRRLIEDLLDISRIVNGKLSLEVRPVGLLAVVKTAIETMRPSIVAKGIQLQTMLDPAVGLVSGDASRLQQVVLNLLSNAIKFTPEGGLMEVGLQQASSQVEIVVKDSGRGISAEFLPYIFDRFRQADVATPKSQGGLGLGLAIVRQLVEMQGGTIQADSPGEGQGATFTVRLPQTVVAEQEVSQEVNQMQASLKPEGRVPLGTFRPLEGFRVLVVDDAADARELLVAVLEHGGAEVTAVASAAEALEALVRWRPHVLMSDIGMPVEDGFDLIRKVRALRPEQGGDIPALALTSYTRFEERTRALSAGFQVHMSKPFDPAELVEVTANLARRRTTKVLVQNQ
ncbi:MAG: hybrid sensor histidine kinase/response regulator [Acidobacteria bacterium]|nr:MAG: hybrid sensor histidine kinase/response regulator [Acidobacteriota bacterium]